MEGTKVKQEMERKGETGKKSKGERESTSGKGGREEKRERQSRERNGEGEKVID